MNDSFQDKENKINSRADDDISLKEIILKIREWWGIVWSRRLNIVSLSLICGLTVALYTKFLIKPTYTASYQLFFQEESAGLSGAMRLASSFGLGGIGGGSTSSSKTVKKFITSRNNIAHAMTAVLENGRLIDRYYTVRMKEDEEFVEEFTANFGTNQRYTDSTLTELHQALHINVLSAFFNEEDGTLAFDVSSAQESFAFDLANILVKNTEEQFKNWKREKSISAVEAFQGKVDSLKTSIDYALMQLGKYEDQNNSLVSSVDKMRGIRLTIDLSKAELMNLEAPFKYFEEPTYPLLKEKKSASKAGVLGSVTAFFLLAIFSIGRVEAKNIMA